MGLVPLLLASIAWDKLLYYWLPLHGTSPSICWLPLHWDKLLDYWLPLHGTSPFITGFHCMGLVPLLPSSTA
jgi:hypothetical protein